MNDAQTEQAPLRLRIVAMFENVAVRIEPAARILAGVGVFALMLITVADIVARKVGTRSIPGVIELVEVTLVAVVFIGLMTASRDAQHIRVTLLTDRIRPFAARIVRILAAAISLAIVGTMLVSTTEKAIASVAAGEYRLGLIPIPIWPARVAIPVGLLGLLIIVIVQLVSLLGGRDEVLGMRSDEFTEIPSHADDAIAPEPTPPVAERKAP